jgi:3-oxoacyl-[acyl-carrier-protein] synthase-3
MANSYIAASGSYLPARKIPNSHFIHNEFFGADGKKLARPNPEIIQKLAEITGIQERRYADPEMVTSDIACLAAQAALEGRPRENLDGIIVAHNMGDVKAGSSRIDQLPSIAARVKHRLGIKNPYTLALDLPFGCPGWLQGVILADYYIKSGDAKRMLVIGAEILSRLSDPHDIDSMIFADGAGATLMEATPQDVGLLAHMTRCDTLENPYLLRMGHSYGPGRDGDELLIKMDGHQIFKYALRTVPDLVRTLLNKNGFDLGDVKKILIHQANEKMDDAILKRLYQLYGIETIPDDVMPMIISWSGNSSVATLPTLFDLIQRQKLGTSLLSGDIVVFASVGAGMNVNAMLYRMP